MDIVTPIAPQHDRPRLLLVDTDNLFLDEVETTLAANEDVDIVGTARCIDDAYDRALRHCPDVIVISWGTASGAFVYAAVETFFSVRGKPLVVIVLPEHTIGTAGLSRLRDMPNVVLVVQRELERLVRWHTAPTASGRKR